MDRRVRGFLDALALTPNLWSSVELRLLAINARGDWHNLLTTLWLSHRAANGSGTPRLLANDAHVFAARQAFPFADLQQLIEAMGTGELTVGDRKVLFRSERNTPAAVPYDYYATSLSQPLRRVRGTSGSVVVGHELMGSGDNVGDRIRGGDLSVETLDLELRASPAPWDGLASLWELGIGDDFDRLDSTSARFHVRAPLSGRLVRTDLGAGMLRATVTVEDPRLLAQLSIGIVALSRGEVCGQKTVRPALVESAPLSASVAVDLSREAEQAVVLLRVGPYVIDRRHVVDRHAGSKQPLRLAAEAADPALSALKENLLESVGAQSQEFEHAVARLFTYCGFHVDAFPRQARLDDFVDLVVYSPDDGLLLTVECTTGPLQSRDGKLARLHSRTHEVLSAVGVAQEGDSSVRVLPLIVTSLARSQIAPDDLESATVNGAIVLGREDLEALLEVATLGTTSSTALNLIKARSTASERLAQTMRGMTRR